MPADASCDPFPKVAAWRVAQTWVRVGMPRTPGAHVVREVVGIRPAPTWAPTVITEHALSTRTPMNERIKYLLPDSSSDLPRHLPGRSALPVTCLNPNKGEDLPDREVL